MARLGAMRDLAPVWDLASRQHGALHVQQLLDAGLDHDGVLTLVRQDHLVRAAPRVLAVAGSADTVERRAFVALLNAGVDACLSHESAAALWGVAGFRMAPWHVTRPRVIKDGASYIATVHEPRRFRSEHVLRLREVPVTTPARTIFDLASLGYVHPGRVARALDSMWAARLVDHRSLTQMLEHLQGKGRPGIRLMRALLTERSEAYVPPESSLERRFMSICDRFGIGGFDRQALLGDDGPIGRVDFVHRAAMVVAEIDSDRFHTSLLDRRADERRDERLSARGYLVLRFTEFDVWYRADDVGRRLLRALSVRAA
jgi:very-short-patch-repair endonuclease